MNEHSWYFSEPAHVAALYAAIDECRGTPWAQYGGVPGGGFDCLGLNEYVLAKAGVGQGRQFSFTRTPADYQTARGYLRILHMLRGRDEDPQAKALAEIFAEIPLPIPQGPTAAGKPVTWHNPDVSLFMPGDLGVLRHGGMFHLPLFTRGRDFVHCVKPIGVADGNIHDPTYSKYLVALFRARDLSASTLQPFNASTSSS
jgi:hypothetical protein